MTARVQIQIEAQDAASGVLRAIVSQFGALGNALSDAADLFSKNNELTDLYTRGLKDMSVSAQDVAKAEEAAQAATARFAETLALLAVDFLKDAITETAKYAEEVHALTLASGASYEQASRLLQVLGDYNITAQDVTTATRRMTENGFAPTVETLATLSDQYNGLNTAQEKNAFLIENLGRGGAEWAKVLALGSDAIMELNAGVSKNLILNQEAYESAEKYRLALDELEDSWTGLKTSFGAAAFEPLANLFELIAKNIDESTQSTGAFLSNMIPVVAIFRSASNAMEIYNENQLASMQSMEGMKELNVDLASSFSDANTAIQESSVNYEDLISSITDYQDELDRYIDKNADLRQTESDLLSTRNDYIVQLGQLKEKYGEGSDAVNNMQGKIDDINGKLDDNKKKLAENEEAHRKWAAQTVFSFAQARAAADGSITKIEGDLLVRAGQALGLFDQQTAEVMSNVNEAFSNLDASNAEAVIGTLTEQIEALTGQSYQVIINTMYTTTGTPPNVPIPVQSSTNASQCFIGGTDVTMWDYTFKKIEDVREGDIVLSYDENKGEFVPRRVEKTFKHEAKGYIILNGKLGVTPNHQMYVNEKWTDAGDIMIGDVLFLDNGTLETVESIEEVQETAFVFNLHTEDDPHNYFADGYLVHNKQMGGEVYAGKMVNVGEAGMESFVPSQNGRILGHAEALHAAGLSGGANYFYGNVTLQVDGDSAGGLLEYR